MPRLNQVQLCGQTKPLSDPRKRKCLWNEKGVTINSFYLAMLKQKKPSFGGKLICRPSFRSKVISMGHLWEDPWISPNHTCGVFRKEIKKSILDHLLCVILWDRQQWHHACTTEEFTGTWPCCSNTVPEALLSTIRQHRLSPLKPPAIGSSLVLFLPLESP